MRVRSILVALASLALGVGLVAVLVVVPGVHLHELVGRIAGMDKAVFVRLMLLIAVNSLLSAYKWRITDREVRGATSVEVSRFEAFALTSMGTALGQFLPVHLSMPISRTLGTWIHGRAIRRGTLGTFFEQAFDFLFVCFVMVASIATHFLHGGAFLWLTLAVASAALAIVCGGTMLSAARRLTARVRCDSAHRSRWRRYAVELGKSGLLQPALGRKLMSLSAARFIVLVLMAAEVGRAIHAGIPLWHFAFAMPAAVLATAAGITPGGLGILEFTYAGALTLLGTPLVLTTTLALANRLLCSAASILVGLLLLPFFLFSCARRRLRSPEAASGIPSDSVAHAALEHPIQ